jgi:hypothetical protein
MALRDRAKKRNGLMPGRLSNAGDDTDREIQSLDENHVDRLEVAFEEDRPEPAQVVANEESSASRVLISMAVIVIGVTVIFGIYRIRAP